MLIKDLRRNTINKIVDYKLPVFFNSQIGAKSVSGAALLNKVGTHHPVNRNNENNLQIHHKIFGIHLKIVMNYVGTVIHTVPVRRTLHMFTFNLL